MPQTEADLVLLMRQGRLALAAVVLGTLWTLETLVPLYGGRSRRVRHDVINITIAVINGLLGYGAAFGLLAVTEYSRDHHLGLVHHLEGPAWARWAVAIVLFDIWQYWWHRASHRVKFLWRFHAVHHADPEMSAASGVRFHPVEIAISFAMRMAVLPLIGMTLPQVLLYETASLPVILFHHANVRLPEKADRCLRWLIVTPWMHWVHHSRLQPETDSNYSSFLSVWDRLFGSFRLRIDPGAIEQGLDGWWDETERRGLLGLLAAPFRGKRKESA